MKMLVFDISADYAHFKKQYTTTSPLTFPVPPKPTVIGVISAIIGLDKSKYLNEFQGDSCSIGIGIRNKVSKVRIGENLIDTENVKTMFIIKQRTPIRIEFLKNPCYRVYFTHKNHNIYSIVKDNLKAHKTFYTISLGLSENLANYVYIGEHEFEEKKESDDVDIATIINQSRLSKERINFEPGKEYFTTVLPWEMLPNREVTRYLEFLLERNGKAIRAIPVAYWHSETLGENITIE